MNVLLLLAHAIEEYDQVRLLSSLGHDVFSIGAYTNPGAPGDDIRPPLPEVPYHPDLATLCDIQRAKHAGESTEQVIDWAKGDLHPALIEWADAIIVHHFERVWLGGQWHKFAGKRVIWRTVGQSMPGNEMAMASLRQMGLQIVRYSPEERNLPGYAGEDALIRFYKDPTEYAGWTGEDRVVLNITQHLMQRGDATNGTFYMQATQGLPRRLVGAGSEEFGGTGRVSTEAMQGHLRRARSYLYTGTQPASYTLGLIEALMTGTPVVSVGPRLMTWTWPRFSLFEGHKLAELSDCDPNVVRGMLQRLLDDEPYAQEVSAAQRERAIATFGIDSVSAAWRDFLGS